MLTLGTPLKTAQPTFSKILYRRQLPKPGRQAALSAGNARRNARFSVSLDAMGDAQEDKPRCVSQMSST